MKFSEWITKKYIEWRGDAIGRNRSVSDFASHVGVTQETMSNWMNGSIPKRQELITRLVGIFGAEVYDILELERPPEFLYDPIYDELHKIFHQMSAEEREQYLANGRSTIEGHERHAKYGD